jgi:dihydrodipicolinate synthase/N-acetylneuraminate lyase
MNDAPNWAGVMPAITTPFDASFSIDHGALRAHCQWLAEHRITGIVALGSLGEGATLDRAERESILRACTEAVKLPVIAAVSALSTKEAVSLAKDAEGVGCSGLMVLPPYVHRGPWREIRGHLDSVIRATPLSCMLYNNPAAYGVDLEAEHVAQLAGDHENLAAHKESSGDVRRVTALKTELGGRLAVFAGLDDMVVEAVGQGAVGWIAGLVNALPAESVALFEAAKAGDTDRAFDLYRWFLPLLRMDTVPEFVQLIKLVQTEVERGSETVRPPRLPVAGLGREHALATIRRAMAERPEVG